MQNETCLLERIAECLQNFNTDNLSLDSYIEKLIEHIQQTVTDASIHIQIKDTTFRSTNFIQHPHCMDYQIYCSRQPVGALTVYLKNPKPQSKQTDTAAFLQIIADLIGMFLDKQETALQLQNTKENEQKSLQALQDFIYITSHDLQEPARIISSYVELLDKRYSNQLDDKAQILMQHTIQAAARMQRLIQHLLDYSRVHTHGHDFTLTDLNTVLENAKKRLIQKIETSRAVITSSPLPQVAADAEQIERVFTALIDNAIKFKSNEPARINIRSDRENAHWKISFSDNGIGIKSQHKDKIFKVFQRLHTLMEYPGDGMGLAICKRIVERHKGHINFTSNGHHGCTFYFTIPINRE